MEEFPTIVLLQLLVALLSLLLERGDLQGTNIQDRLKCNLNTQEQL
jgi:hypothetical protein